MKVTLYIDGEHNTVEVKDKIKSVLPDANYMIFDPTESKGKVTEFDRIKNMSVEEVAIAIFNLDLINGGLNCEKCCAYTTDGKCNKTDNDGKGTCVDGIKQWLETEVETE